ncbi:hypothetical protein BRARA_H00416 [Brassica rapa]|uniref:Amino acid transporter transmembrane domain-containing protein n=1 Tax=Brassica campestris TaxID=3711 RepID=A0A397Y9P9_BRACM|nr:hypothetical protein BRARA_H00416 [Brassica rapa]
MATKDEVQNDPLLQASESDGHEEFNGASFTGAVLNLATAIIGAGIMALPATMKILGLVPGIVMILLMAFLTDKTIDFLLRFSGIGNARRSYGALMEDSFGKTGRIVLQVAILVTNIGVLIVYMIIIGDVLEGMLEGWFGESWWDKRTIVLLFTTLCVFAPLTSFKRIDTLRFTSALLGMDLTHPQSPSNKGPSPANRVDIGAEADSREIDSTGSADSRSREQAERG